MEKKESEVLSDGEKESPKLWHVSDLKIINRWRRDSIVWQFHHAQQRHLFVHIKWIHGAGEQFFAKNSRKNCIVEVEMFYTQFAEAITSLNIGDGVPVTITNIGGEFVPKCPYEAMSLY